ncbi:integrase core domain-containing protein [Bacteroides thetaiotaomicron]|uniref:integrase core domain-containing protein n=1 Tax=Bacteroides thetaiotaomicron TaxID=818 RepID=UPI00286D9680|nr:integrase core domain-containing protein [Bacteroides thetaiotaomicron]MCS2220414.1 integrase core domain-containing protein [Bacteroides thetaiotaomicron]
MNCCKECALVQYRKSEKAVATAVHFYNNERPHMSLDMLTPVQAGEMQGPIRKRWISYREKYLNVALA